MEKLIYDSCEAFEVQRLEYSIWKGVLQKLSLTLFPGNFQNEYIWNTAVRFVCAMTNLLV